MTAGLMAAVACCAGCSSGVAQSPAAQRPAQPGCAKATAPSAALGSVRTSMLTVPGNPFGVAATPDGRWAFTAVTGAGGSGAAVGVLRLTGGVPAAVRDIAVPGAAAGEAITPDGRYLLAADGDGAVVISVARAETGKASPVLGTLDAPGGSAGAVEVAVSPDGRFAFVTMEDSRKAVVFNLGAALTRGFGPADYVGSIPLELAPVGLAVSPDGRWLYATSEIGSPAGRAAQPAGSDTQPGTLSVIDLRRAETDPAASVVATVDAGCQPVRVITSASGSQVWVTARASDDLLGFAADRLAKDPAKALVAAVRVGEAPVGLAAVRGGSLVVVADSNRFGAGGANSDLDVVNVASALAGRPAVAGHIRAGQFPRDMALAPDGTLLVSDFDSRQLEAIATATIPGG